MQDAIVHGHEGKSREVRIKILFQKTLLDALMDKLADEFLVFTINVLESRLKIDIRFEFCCEEGQEDAEILVLISKERAEAEGPVKLFDRIALILIYGPDHFIDISDFKFFNNAKEKLTFAAEVGIEGSFGEPHLFHDVIDGGTVIAGADKQLQCRLNDLSFCFFTTFHRRSNTDRLVSEILERLFRPCQDFFLIKKTVPFWPIDANRFRLGRF
jgi:hypothetical protein